MLVRIAGGKRGKEGFRYVTQALRDEDSDGETYVQGYRSRDVAKTQFMMKEFHDEEGLFLG